MARLSGPLKKFSLKNKENKESSEVENKKIAQTLTGHETVFTLRYMEDINIDRCEIEFSAEWHRQNRGLYGPNKGLCKKTCRMLKNVEE